MFSTISREARARRRRALSRVGRAGVAALAIAGCTTTGLTTIESEIRGGSTDDGDPAVATLSVFGLYSYCTATLISRHTVLTAGHCNLFGMEADFGTDADAPIQSIDVTKVAVHPQYTEEGAPYDLALMQLASDPIGIASVALNDAPLAAGDVGRMLRHVGFGATDDATGDGSGTKRTVSYALNRIDGMLIYSGAPGKQSCVGDSGGPAFLTGPDNVETLVGVVSDGPDCQLSQDGWDDRVDLVKDWIAQTVSAWDAPPSFGSGDAQGGGPGGGSGNGRGGGSGGGDSTAASPGCTAAPGHTGLGLCVLGALALLRRRRPAPRRS